MFKHFTFVFPLFPKAPCFCFSFFLCLRNVCVYWDLLQFLTAIELSKAALTACFISYVNQRTIILRVGNFIIDMTKEETWISSCPHHHYLKMKQLLGVSQSP